MEGKRNTWPVQKMLNLKHICLQVSEGLSNDSIEEHNQKQEIRIIVAECTSTEFIISARTYREPCKYKALLCICRRCKELTEVPALDPLQPIMVT